MKYDLVVVGGGSGGLAAAKQAAKLGAKTLLFDFVEASPCGTVWGVGGTCVNVGCIPKKLMHYAASYGQMRSFDAKAYGWNVEAGKENQEHDWGKLIVTVQNHIKMLNFGYKRGLQSSGVTYVNAHASLKGKNADGEVEVEYFDKKSNATVTATCSYVFLAPGGRPSIPAIPGAELLITSDDLFSLKTAPRKTLVVGASYVALECAGFLNHLGFDVTVAVRSIVLRGFDRQCADKLKTSMTELGVRFREAVVLKSLAKVDSQVQATFSDDTQETYDTVLCAIGRGAQIAKLGLEKLDIALREDGHGNPKIVVDANDETSCANVFAIGDAGYGRPELTPVAIKAGELLAARLFGGGKKEMDYKNIPTAVYTPIEYGCVGMTEEAAVETFGEANIETYLYEFPNLEHAAGHREKVAVVRASEFDTSVSPTCLSKLICLKCGDRKVLGWHCVAPHASEMTQGFAIAIRMGATKQDFDNCVGLHPTDVESFCSLDITRGSGESFVATGGCAGGKCG